MLDKIQIILASGSPRRRELMDRIGAEYVVIPSNKEEDMSGHEPAKMVEELSLMKATDVEEKVILDNKYDKYCIIGCDTVVAFGSSILGKPHSEEEAFNMIKNLSNNSHYVFTGVCLIINDGTERKLINYHVATEVFVTTLTDDEINAYIATGEPMDKAGAYAIQGKFAPYIKGLNGDYYNIVGYPISSIYHTLKENGIQL